MWNFTAQMAMEYIIKSFQKINFIKANPKLYIWNKIMDANDIG